MIALHAATMLLVFIAGSVAGFLIVRSERWRGLPHRSSRKRTLAKTCVFIAVPAMMYACSFGYADALTQPSEERTWTILAVASYEALIFLAALYVHIFVDALSRLHARVDEKLVQYNFPFW